MNKKQELLQLKKQRTKIRIIGFCIMPLGYAIMGLCMASGSPLGILGMFIAFAGIMLILRSFMHFKYAGLNKALAEYDANPELQYIPEDVDLGIMNIVRSTFEKHFEAYGVQLIKQQYSIDATGSLVHKRTNQALLQIANLSQIDDETLFMLYATLCNRVRTQDQRAVIQNECVFRTLYKRYSNSLEIVKERTAKLISNDMAKKETNFVSFSETDTDGNFKEAYGYFEPDSNVSSEQINGEICVSGNHDFMVIEEMTGGIKYRCKKCGLEDIDTLLSGDFKKKYNGSYIDNASFRWHSADMSGSSISKLHISFGDCPIINIEWHGETLTYRNTINGSRDGGRAYPSGFFDTKTIVLSNQQIMELRELLNTISFFHWTTENQIFDRLGACGFCLHNTFKCSFSNGREFICYSCGGFEEFHQLSSLLKSFCITENNDKVNDDNTISCCGKYYSTKDNFCSECGRKLSKTSDVGSTADDNEITCSPGIDFLTQEKLKSIKFEGFGFWVESIHQVEKLLTYMTKAVEIARVQGYTIGAVRVDGGVHELDTGYESFSGKIYLSFEEARNQLPVDFAEEEAKLDGQWLNTMNFELFTVDLAKDGNNYSIMFSRGELKVPEALWKTYEAVDWNNII
ncbi:hypothetical protein [Anaeromassilibacillus sp. 1001302B_160321_C8]|uniref:hypothetical protein n=1 Tax=Anaeromassilibacillus sp. 1001302B_160321_C8 TaxID=2787132 RepID=UPI001896DB4C|nr:hypothetical protein [Anaeromassilibacillus sp. 1001302B_160321_C8]